MCRRLASFAAATILVLSALSALAVIASPAAHADVDLDPYEGLGVWVDVFDYAPRLQSAGATPRVTVDSIDDMANLGARTLYLQVANPDDAPSNQLTDRVQLRALVRRAHDHDLTVVAWFLPYVTDLDADDQFVRQLVRLRVDGQGFDAIALDIEDTRAVPDLAERNDRVIELARRARAVMGDDMALGGIVYPAVQLDVVNPTLWPNFPYKRLADSIDVWMPMSYFTFRDEESGYRDAFRYSEESVTRLRKHLDDDDATVHLVGGIADQVTTADLDGFLRAAQQTDAIGWSLYDYSTTFSTAWPTLRRGASRG
ncbi:MAG: hypothetical protein ABW033_06985 [Acidimicrobiia bacterium]